MSNTRRLDGSHWALILLGVISIGTIACFAMAAAAQSRSTQADILMTDNFPPPAEL